MLFDFLFADGQGFESGTVISTELFANTRVFLRDGTELDQLAIVPDVTGIIDGVIVPGLEGSDDLLRAAFVVLDPADEPADILLSGTVIAVQSEAGTFDLMVDGETPRCIDANDADIRLVSGSDDLLTDEPGELGDIVPEAVVDVFGQEGSGCFEASSVDIHTSSPD
jgi:hypothetical protein